MSSADDHIRQASHNQRILEFLLCHDPLPYDWITTVAFYKGVHLVEALFDADMSKHSGSHGERSVELKSQKRYEKIYQHYGPLYRAGRVARYLGIGTKTYSGYAAYKAPKQVINELLNHNLRQIEKSVIRLLPTGLTTDLQKLNRLEFDALPFSLGKVSANPSSEDDSESSIDGTTTPK